MEGFEILSFVQRVLYRSPPDWDVARSKPSDLRYRSPVTGEIEIVASGLIDVTLRIHRENSRISSGLPTIEELIGSFQH
jgi:hypothetical protein